MGTAASVAYEKNIPTCLQGKVMACAKLCLRIHGANLEKPWSLEPAAKWLTEHAQSNASLWILSITYCNIKPSGARTLAHSLIPLCPNLKTICMDGNPIADEAASIARALRRHCPDLEAASFANTGMTDSGFNAVCQNLPNERLTRLSVHTNPITTIPASMSRFQSLQVFDAQNNPWFAWAPAEDPKATAQSAVIWAEGLTSDHCYTMINQGSKKSCLTSNSAKKCMSST